MEDWDSDAEDESDEMIIETDTENESDDYEMVEDSTEWHPQAQEFMKGWLES